MICMTWQYIAIFVNFKEPRLNGVSVVLIEHKKNSTGVTLFF